MSWNQADRLIHGTDNRGTRNGLAKLDADKVRKIRTLLIHTSIADIARRYDVHYGTIKQVATGKAWSWVQ